MLRCFASYCDQGTGEEPTQHLTLTLIAEDNSEVQAALLNLIVQNTPTDPSTHIAKPTQKLNKTQVSFLFHDGFLGLPWIYSFSVRV